MWILSLSLLLSAPAPVPAPLPGTPPPAVRAVPQDVAALRKEFDEALRAWSAELKAASPGARAELRKSHPALTFWERFEALARSGDAGARLWMLENVQDRGLGREERASTKLALYRALVPAEGDPEVRAEAVRRLPKDAREIGLANAIEILDSVLTGMADPELKALTTLTLANLLEGSEGTRDRARGKRLSEEYTRTYVSVGAQAPDFRARTIDDHPFRLSDYRGKVVLVDFYGFW